MVVGALLHRAWRTRALAGGLVAAAVALVAVGPWVVHCRLHRGYTGVQDAGTAVLFTRVWYLQPNGLTEPELRRNIEQLVAQQGLGNEMVRRYVIPPLLLRQMPRGDVPAEAALYGRLGRIADENLRNHWPAYLADSARQFAANLGGYWLFWWPAYWDAPAFDVNIRQGQWAVVAIKLANRVVWPAAMILLSAPGAGQPVGAAATSARGCWGWHWPGRPRAWR